MRIPDNQASGVGASGVNRAQETVTATSANRTGGQKTDGGAGDAIQLSNLAASLRAQSPGSAERTARIEHLRMQIAGGTYQPDAQKISQALIDEATGSSRDVKRK